ncbi:hypothetical protein [Bradyrhizobium cenepequi]|uniref:hypothetical protein n=1 Tax=Bradyrhizobium cenepequi TaxID=2821403 RepID=UPI001CE39893|nr:hypothetical protein [Bradyrhizobium cenepequi]MCA6105717.1 hypothetical protein [Bradyrhizobium cenepequi]
MKRILLIGAALVVSMFGLTASASARLGIAPMASTSDALVQVRGGYGHGYRGYRRGRGHHYGRYRGRGHHYGWRYRRSY